MKYRLVFALAFAFVLGCSNGSLPPAPPAPTPTVTTTPAPSPRPSPTPTVSPSPSPRPSPSPSPSISPSPAPVLTLGTITNADISEYPMIAQAIADADLVLVSACFEADFLAASLTHSNGLTNAEVYQTLVAPPIVINVDYYNGSWWENYVYHTVGWESTADPNTVHVNRFFVTTASEMADNVLHEMAHARGYIHVSASEHTSVPYTMNSVYEACAPGFGL